MKYYEAYDLRYNELHKLNMEWESKVTTQEIQAWISHYSIMKRSDILEIGCGEGRDSIKMINDGFNVTGIDVSKSAIGKCLEKSSAGNFLIWDIVKNPLKTKYNYAYSISTLHMLVLDEDRKSFLTNIYESLENNGIFLLMNMGDGEMERRTNIEEAFDTVERTHLESGKKIQVAATSCRIVNEKTHRSEIESAGFKIEHYKYVETENFGICSAVYLRKSHGELVEGALRKEDT